MNFYDLINAWVARDAAEAGQLTLGVLIEKLATCDPAAVCDVDTGDGPSASLTSYRGYYDHLAIEPGQQDVTVEVILHALREAVGSTYEGYKGGRYVMRENTPVWIAHWGASGSRIVDVKDDGARTIIITEQPKE